MEDLLREDEFVVKEHFNHWKYFSVFYFLAIIHIIIFYFIIENVTIEQVGYVFYAAVMLLNIVFPILLAVRMILNNKNAIILPVRLIFLSLVFLVSSYFVGMMLISVITIYLNSSVFTINEIYIALGFCSINLFLFSIIIIPIAIYRQKKLKQTKPQSSSL